MPSMLMSSSRPTKGEMKVAPALAASSAWFAEKQRVTLTIRPSSESVRQALSPSQVSGTFTAMFGRELRELAALGHHPLVVERHGLGADRPLDLVADLADHLDEVAARFLDEARVRRHAVDQAERVQLANLVDLGGVHEEFHEGSLRLAGVSPCGWAGY